MLINPDKNYLYKSFSKLLPQKHAERRNRRTLIESKTNNSIKDSKNKAYPNINNSFLKNFSVLNESNYDSNYQTDISSNNMKEIRVNKSAKQRKKNLINIQKHNSSKNENIFNDIQPMNTPFLEDDKLAKISYIQIWWKNIYKIILIQKYIRSFLVKNNIAKIRYFINWIYKLLFKIMICKIKNIINKNKNALNSSCQYNDELKKKINKNKIRRSKNYFKNFKLNNQPYFNTSNNFNSFILNKKLEDLKNTSNKKCKNENLKKYVTINNNKANNKEVLFDINNKSYCKNKNKIKKANKIKIDKEKLTNNFFSNKNKLIAENIFNIYKDVKKYYEKENQNNNNDSNYSTATNFYKKNQKNQTIAKNNTKNLKMKKTATKRSMKNISDVFEFNKNNIINPNINVNNNNAKSDRTRENKSKKEEMNSILLLLKLKKAFIFWNSYIIKKNIIQKIKLTKDIKTPLTIKITVKKENLNKKSLMPGKKVNISNSLMNLKKNKIISNKLKIKNENLKKNSMINNYKKITLHKKNNSIDYNKSMSNLKPDFNCSFNIENKSKFQPYKNKDSEKSEQLFNKSVIVINEFDRNKNKDNKPIIQNDNNFNINNINETKKIYYFYAIVNLIDKHNKRKKLKNYFNNWKSNKKVTHSFINSCGIEEKIISFKNKKSALKNNLNGNKINKKNLFLIQNNSSGNVICQTETNDDPRHSQCITNSTLENQDLFISQNLEKVIHINLFKSNIKPTIIYQKKLLVPQKIRNQPKSIKNNVDEERNIAFNNNNPELSFLNQSTDNTFFGARTYINNNNELNNTQYMLGRNYIGNKISVGKSQEGRINRVSEMEEKEIYFNPNKNSTLKNSFILRKKKINEEKEIIRDNVNNNIVENYIKKEDINNSNYKYNDKGIITTKPIRLAQKKKRYKICSHSQETRNNV